MINQLLYSIEGRVEDLPVNLKHVICLKGDDKDDRHLGDQSPHEFLVQTT